MKPIIRAVGAEQLDACAQVIRESFMTVADEFGFTIENNPSNGAFIQTNKLFEEYNRDVVMFGIYLGEEQAGFVAVEKKDDNLYYLEKLAVSPKYRHQGYGMLLMDYVKEYVKAAGGKQISIGIIDENTVLKSWYQKYGFKQTSVKKFDHLTFAVCFMLLSL